ncbi:MAG: hypothetical protein JNL52_00050 [Flavobacteriales bacterium]|nr:hypothetical protein [Flavobacteriales bacterium]
MKMQHGRSSLLMVLLLATVVLVVTVRVRIIGDNGVAWQGAINSDGEGYVAYLNGLIIHGDLRSAEAAEQHFTPAGHRHVIQYYAGTALLQAPFFFIAHVVQSASGSVQDKGYELPYQLAIIVSSLFYFILGLHFTRLTLSALGLADRTVALTLLIIALGTGLPYYAIISPAMSHVYGFAAIAWCMYEARRAWTDRPYAPERLMLALAITLLIRPTHVLIIPLLPVVAYGDGKRVLSWIRHQRPAPWFRAALIGTAVLLIQPLAWHAQCGQWWVDPYATEGFHWLQPRIWSVLFGARKGLFFYWPLLLLLLPGIWFLFRNRKDTGLSFAIGLIVIIYLTSTWWSWYYGHGYGMRPFLDLLPLMAVPIGLCIRYLPKRSMPAASVAISVLVGLQVFQSWQYHVGIIHPFNMDREKYRMIFMNPSVEMSGRIGWANMASPYAPHGMEVLKTAHLKEPFTGRDTLHLDTAKAFSPAITLSAAELPQGRTLWVDVSVERSASSIGASNTVDMVYTLRHNGKDRAYGAFPLNDIRSDDDRPWRRWKHGFLIPAARSGEELVVYLWQHGNGTVLIRDLNITISAVRERPE